VQWHRINFNFIYSEIIIDDKVSVPKFICSDLWKNDETQKGGRFFFRNLNLVYLNLNSQIFLLYLLYWKMLFIYFPVVYFDFGMIEWLYNSVNAEVGILRER
jgi:hypothetical protein